MRGWGARSQREHQKLQHGLTSNSILPLTARKADPLLPRQPLPAPFCPLKPMTPPPPLTLEASHGILDLLQPAEGRCIGLDPPLGNILVQDDMRSITGRAHPCSRRVDAR